MDPSRTVRSLVATSALTMLVVGCKLFSKEDATDAGSDAAAVVPVAAVADDASASSTPPPGATPVTASNAGQVGRFKDEQALSEPATTLSPASAQVAPGTSREVAYLKAGTAVTKVASRREDGLKADYFLVTFVDPKNAAQTLMGWVPAAAFKYVRVDAGAVDAGPKPADAATKG